MSKYLKNSIVFIIVVAVFSNADGESLKYQGRRSSRSPGLDCFNKLGDKTCNYLTSQGYCNSRSRSMRIYCRRSCKICVDPPCHLSRYGCCFDNKTLAKGPHMLGCNDDCKDRKDKQFCMSLKRNGECYKDHEATRMQCPVTCGYCRPCEDLDTTACQLALMYGGCSARKGKMANICRKTCNICGKNDPCIKFMCPKGSVCEVDENMKPFCKCHGNCKPGDYYTGITCGRDGVEYKNLCELKKRNCGHPEIDQITVKKYGKCQDNIAASYRQTLCKKVKEESAICRSWVAKGYCTSHQTYMVKLCPRSCNNCAAQAAKPSCHYTKFGCCLDNKTKCLGTDYKGCPKFPACKDFSKVFCRRFTPLCGVNKYQTRMAHYCGKSCNVCM